MKKILCLLLTVITPTLMALYAGALARDELTAETAVLIDADTGQVLFDKKMNTRRRPASMTKIMTGLLVMENCEPQETVTVSETAVDLPWDASHIALTPGEELPVDSAMYALMMPSANDAANALAEHVAGTQEQFARMMTARAVELGALNTNFSNPNGLDEPLHYTTALDMALITMEAAKNPELLRYMGTARHTIPATNMQSEERPFTNQQYMLLPDMWVYNPDVAGGKVGFTDEARHTMSTVAKKSGRTLIAVVMGCGADQKFYDTQALLDYGFGSFTKVDVPEEKISGLIVPVLEEGEAVGEAEFSAEEGITVLLPEGRSAGDIEYRYDLPESVERGKAASAAVALTVSRAGLDGFPEVLMEIPLKVSFRYDALPEDAEAWKQGQVEPIENKFKTRLWFAAPIVVAAAAVFVRKVRIDRRRARRLRRMERVMSQRERY